MVNKLFQISADFNLTVKPDWLDAFRHKYDLPYDFHVTLKTTTCFNPTDEEEIKQTAKQISEKQEPLEVIFEKLYISQAPSGWCIMIEAKPNDELIKLQKIISDSFSKYGEHASEDKRRFEKEFRPHITIARHLTKDELKQAQSELGTDLHCKSLINNLSLYIADEDNFSQWSKPENRFVYKFTN